MTQENNINLSENDSDWEQSLHSDESLEMLDEMALEALAELDGKLQQINNESENNQEK